MWFDSTINSAAGPVEGERIDRDTFAALGRGGSGDLEASGKGANQENSRHESQHQTLGIAVSRVCILTPGQPSTNPRVVKEADALAAAGYHVHVICARNAGWADATDIELLRQAQWTCEYVGGNAGDPLYRWTRARYAAARKLYESGIRSSLVVQSATSRVQSELEAATLQHRADLYIAHYTPALVAAAKAAQTHGAKFAYDAEDFETGARPVGAPLSAADKLVEQYERSLLPLCAYVSASSSGIAQAYVDKYGMARPATILNVFPLAERPSALREVSSAGPVRLYWFSQTIGGDRGLEDVVRALGMLAQRGCVDCELHLRGNWSAGYHDALSRFAAGCGFAPERIIHHAPIAPRAMVASAAEYDIGLALEQRVSYNRDICLTNKIFTYLLAGNAVVATATAGQREIMAEIGDAGLTYEPGDAATLANGLEHWYRDRTALRNSRSAGWQAGSRKYNWEYERQRLLELVAQALHQKSATLKAESQPK